MKKHFITALAALVICAANPVFTANAEVMGDVNGDGKFSVADVIALQRWLQGRSDSELKNRSAADMCRDDSINVYDLVAMRKALVKSPANNEDITPEPVFIHFEEPEEYDAFVAENDLSGKMVTYDKVREIGEFARFDLRSSDPNNYAYISYGFDDGSGHSVYLSITDLEKMQPNAAELPKLSDDDIYLSDMRLTSSAGATGEYTIEGRTYRYSAGKLLCIKWYDDTHEYVLTGNTYLSDYPIDSGTYTARLLSFSLSEPTSPSAPLSPTAQPVPFKDIDELAERVAAHEIGSLSSRSYAYERMFSTMKNRRFYAVKTNDKIAAAENTVIYANPYAKYEDIGIFNYITYNGINYQIMVYYTDPAIPAESYKEYSYARFGVEQKKVVDLYGRKICMSKYNNDPCGYGMIDESHYFCVRTMGGGTDDDVLNLVNILEFEEIPLS